MTDATAVRLLPDFAVRSADGAATTLHAARAGRRAVVYFLRSSTCPVCASHVRLLQRMDAAGELGERALLLVVPGGEEEAAHVARRHPQLPHAAVWASEDGHAAAGLGTSMTLQHSGVVVLDAAGAETYRRSAAVPLRSLDAGELRTALR